MGNKNNVVEQEDFYILKPLNDLRWYFYSPVCYIWITNGISNQNLTQKQIFLKMNKTEVCQSIQQVVEIVNIRPSQKFRLIVSGNQVQEVCIKFQQTSNIDQIYFFSIDTIKDKEIMMMYPKSHTEGSTFLDFYKKLNDRKRLDYKYKSIPIFSEICSDESSIHLLRYNIQILLDFTNKKKAKEDFIRLAQHIYQDEALTNILDFQNRYQVNRVNKTAINQFTKQTFFYKLINNVLKISQDPFELIYIRLPVYDLYHSIREIYQNDNKIYQKKYYRGAKMSQDQINFFKKNIGKQLQMLGFLSANKKKSIAQHYIQNILITIQIINIGGKNMKLETGFVDTTDISEYGEQQQVIFNILNVFKVQSIQVVNDITMINLIYGELPDLESKLDQGKIIDQNLFRDLKQYKFQKQIIKQAIKTQGDILFYCGRYTESIQFYKWYVEKINSKQIIKDKEQIAKIYNQIGRCYQNLHSFQKALKYYNQNLKLILDISGSEHKKIGHTYQKIANIYKQQNQFQLALQYYHLALQIQTPKGANKILIAGIYKQIGIIYQQMNLLNQALENYLQCQAIKRSILDQQHTLLSNIYMLIGGIYDAKDEQQIALQYYKKCLKIQSKCLGSTHFSLAGTYNRIAVIYDNQELYNEALEYYTKALKIHLNTVGQNHSLTASSYNNVAGVYFSKQQHDSAEIFYLKCLQIKLKNLKSNHPSIAITYHNLGINYIQTKKIDKAKFCLEKAAEIQSILSEFTKCQEVLDYLKKCHQQNY